MMSLLPVVVMKMSQPASLRQSSIGLTTEPSMEACRAQMGSISATMTWAPWARREAAVPLPTSPYPATKQVLPPIITSVARMIPSAHEWRYPYRLSNLHLVTESLTLMQGMSREPSFCISYRRLTPVVLSSDTPRSLEAIPCHRLVLPASRPSLMMVSTILNSGLVVDEGSGTVPSFSNSFSALTPSWMRRVASPPSSTIMSGPSPLPQSRQRSVHHQYSSRVSPFQAKTAALSRATAAAAWSWVEKMLQEHQRTSAPRSTSVSMSTAVWMVMCRDPLILHPAKGLAGPNSVRQAMSPGISTSARSISMRPKSACVRSFTLKSRPEAVFSTSIVIVVGGGGSDARSEEPPP